MKTYFFLSGLPRSGSTLLSNILNQNPDIYCSPEQSVVCDLLFYNEKYFLTSQEHQSWTNESGKNKVLNSIIQNFYSHRSEKYIIDKSRTWGTPYNLELIRKYITQDIKIICPVRPILEILASFIKLFHENGSGGFVDDNIYSNDRLIYRPIDDVRCDELMIPGGALDKALFALSQHKNNDGIFHFVEYDDLVFNTKKTIQDIYNFLEIAETHNFEKDHNGKPFSEYGDSGDKSSKKKHKKNNARQQPILMVISVQFLIHLFKPKTYCYEIFFTFCVTRANGT